MHRLKPLLASAIILLIAAACGLKGPLYLPADETPVPAAGSEQSEEPEKEKSREKEDGGSHEENP